LPCNIFPRPTSKTLSHSLLFFNTFTQLTETRHPQIYDLERLPFTHHRSATRQGRELPNNCEDKTFLVRAGRIHALRITPSHQYEQNNTG
jgi:hypothetical protein